MLLVRSPSDLCRRIPVAILIGDGLVAIALIRLLARQGYALRLCWFPRTAWPVFKRALPVLGVLLAGLLIFNLDIVFLSLMRPSETVGLYAAAYSLIGLLANVCTLYGITLLPTLTRLRSHTLDERQVYHTAMAQIFALTLPISVGGVFVAQNAILLGYGEEYRLSGPVLQILVWTVVPYALRVVAWAALVARGDQGLALRAIIYEVFANATLNLVLIRFYGMAGAAAASVATEVLTSALTLHYAVRTGFPMTPLVRFWRPVAAVLIMAAVSMDASGWSCCFAVGRGHDNVRSHTFLPGRHQASWPGARSCCLTQIAKSSLRREGNHSLDFCKTPYLVKLWSWSRSSEARTIFGDATITEGLLYAQGRGSAFPIISGVPVMIPSAFPKAFLEKHRIAVDELAKQIKLGLGTSSADDFSFSSQWEEFFRQRVDRTWGWTVAERIDQLLMEMQVDREWFRGKAVLDAGCGPGEFTDAIAALGANVVGFDYASTLYEAERRRQSRTLQFVRGDIAEAGLKGEMFDAVLSMGVVMFTQIPIAVLRRLAGSSNPEAASIFVWIVIRKASSVGTSNIPFWI